MEMSVVERWDSSREIELFYDLSARKILFKSAAVISTFQVDQLVTGQSTLIPGYE
jgi:hypothetical protein